MTRSFDVFFICVWINGWVNNSEAGDWRRNRGHYDVIVMHYICKDAVRTSTPRHVIKSSREDNVIQIKICAEYRDMLPRPRLVCQEPGLRPIGRSPGVPDKSSRGLGSKSRYSAQILICFIAYIFLFFFSFLCGFGWELCMTASMHSALSHCPL